MDVAEQEALHNQTLRAVELKLNQRMASGQIQKSVEFREHDLNVVQS